MNFMCRYHRQSITQAPDLAVKYWHYWMDLGIEKLQTKCWWEAAKLLGGSFEIAESLIQHDPLPALNHNCLSALDRYMISGHHLAESFGQAQRPDLELHFLLKVHQKLIHCAHNSHKHDWPLKENLQLSLHMLERFQNLNHEFTGFDACLKSTENCIAQLEASLN